MGKKVIPLAVFREYQQRMKPTLTSYTVKERKIRLIRDCRHEDIVMDEERMVCRCARCEAIIHPFWIPLEYADDARITNQKLQECNAAIAEFEKIKSEWSLTQAERRRINKAKENARWD